MPEPRPELLLLVPTTSYRLDDFRAAARRLGVPLVVGSDLCHKVEELFLEREDQVSLDYRRPERAAEQIAEVARTKAIRGIVPASDATAVISALALEKLGLPHNPPQAARRAANKHEQRETLRAAGASTVGGRVLGLPCLQTTELPRELEPAPIDAGLHCPFGQIQLLRDFLIRELLQIPQHHGLAQRRRELGQTAADELPQVELLELAVRTAVPRQRVEIGRIHLARHGLALFAHAAIVIDTEIAADADEPGLEIRPAVEGVQRLEDLEEDVLGQVLGLVVPAHELVRDVEDLAPVLAHDLLPCRLVAAQATLDQRVDRGGLEGEEIGTHEVAWGGNRDDSRAFFGMSNRGAVR